MVYTSRTILIVEDNPDFRMLVRKVLERSGYRVAEADNGHTALTYLSEHEPPSLIVLDLRMPVMDGWEFREAQLREPGWRDIPTLVCTCEPSAVSPRPELRANGYLNKSGGIAALVRSIHEFCQPEPAASPV